MSPPCTTRREFLTGLATAVLCGSAAPAIGRNDSAHQVAEIGGMRIPVFTFRPARHQSLPLLFVFHGLHRDARAARDAARALAERLGFVVVAPLFDEEHFPSWRYQLGGVMHHHRSQDARTWTTNLVLELVEWARRKEGRRLDYYLLGHSAGGQLLSRVAAYAPTEARRIVIANPSSYVLPRVDIDAPFGFNRLFSGAQATAQLQHYLAQPITIYIGQDDVGAKELSMTAQAQAQGANRYERGLHTFQMARAIAMQNNWPLNWRLTVVPGVAHNAPRMYSHPKIESALRA